MVRLHRFKLRLRVFRVFRLVWASSDQHLVHVPCKAHHDLKNGI